MSEKNVIKEYEEGIKYYEEELKKHPDDEYVQTEFKRRKENVEKAMEEELKKCNELTMVFSAFNFKNFSAFKVKGIFHVKNKMFIMDIQDDMLEKGDLIRAYDENLLEQIYMIETITNYKTIRVLELIEYK